MSSEIKISVEDLTFSYGDHVVLDRVAAQFATHRITAITGPSGQGKSTFLCAINRLSDEIPGARVAGRIEINFEDGKLDVYRDRYYLPDLRRRVGLVFQKPNPLPISIARNVMLPLALAGRHSRARKLERCEAALRDAFLWDEVKDRLDQSALELSGGQQQRLCIARALVLRPEIIMLDEPTSSLDSEAASQVEELLKALRDRCTIIVVSHYLEQVSRIADRSYRIKDRKVVPVS